MKNKEQLVRLIGKTITGVHMSDAHGDVLILTFSDGSKLNVGTYDSDEVREGLHYPDELAVFLNNEEL